jgi:endonuclease/exonuclease/phosphatase family metal-dependent hydrolase
VSKDKLTTPAMSRSSPQPRPLRLVTYNAALLPGMPWGLGWASKITPLVMDEAVGRRRMRAMLETMFVDDGDAPADVVCLQEIWDTVLFSWSRVLREEIERMHLDLKVYADPIPWTAPINSGLAIVTRFVVADRDHQAFVASSGLQWFVPKGFQYMSILSPSMEVFHVINTHVHASAMDTAICNNANKCVRIQQQQIMQISDFLRTNIQSRHRIFNTAEYTPLIVIAGDFNVDARNAGPDIATDSTVPFLWLESHFRLRFGLRHMGHHADTRDFPVTYPYFSIPVSMIIDPEIYNHHCCLDHVFSNYPYTTRPKTMRIYDDQSKSHASDHSPVVCAISWQA